jgi:hypothetical protein
LPESRWNDANHRVQGKLARNRQAQKEETAV